MGFHQFFKSTFDATCDVTPSTFKCAFSRSLNHRISRFLFPMASVIFFASVVFFKFGRPGLIFDLLYWLMIIVTIYGAVKLNLQGERYFVDFKVDNNIVHLTYRKYFKVIDIQFHMDEVEMFFSESIHLLNGEQIKFLLVDRIKPTKSIETNQETFERFFEQLVAEHNTV